MEPLFSILSGYEFVLVLAIAMLAGMVKGLVGFAMPMIFVSGLSTVLPPDWALAGLILPTLVTNGLQALRQGAQAAVGSIRQFRVFLLVGLACLLATSQLVTRIPASVFLLLIAVPVVVFATIQLLGIRFRLNQASPRSEALVGAFAGSVGGMSGVWGPPTVAYLTALNTPKHDQMRIQGVIYGLGALALTLAHLGSGVLRGETLPLSLLLIAPSVIGMWLGGQWQDRIDQNMFRKLTLIVLLVAGLNLLRRALMG
ncbi:sulfite exporter TauE/SafE family protein [Ruegeria sp. 2205SS24-7]|uniref:sulfite exporter TauE/SafE family protein n=1 Tax=Ruegeria discodermiae TaxID=3064389 RepID=UPI0027413729|nr:sulfite exporter TauE/SafE family protein [Ruegeria sp. 2205SS24-7]MDP5219707.1 sulfite exporter TauE/SafE family protein [Ruegeria sp. 2205SS24-7]